jgi:hypothetical protein
MPTKNSNTRSSGFSLAYVTKDHPLDGLFEWWCRLRLEVLVVHLLPPCLLVHALPLDQFNHLEVHVLHLERGVAPLLRKTFDIELVVPMVVHL